MEIELWWLLALPLIFSLGWLAARIDTRQVAQQSAQMPDAYFRGLNFLLNEQPDKAIDAFIEVMKADPETVELHFALGNLFRRRGETDRAIRVHESLAARADLPGAQREHALYELGQDYLRAGLLDRAENAFVQLEGSAYAAPALRHRLDIAQMVRDWPRALDLAQRFRQGEGTDAEALLAQLHCELAQQALSSVAGASGVAASAAVSGTSGGTHPAGPSSDRLAEVARQIELALQVAPAHPRAWLIKAELALAHDDDEAALAAWRELARISPAHVGLIADRWLQVHERQGRLAQGLAALQAMLGEQPPVDALRAMAQSRARSEGNESAIAWLRGMLSRHPSLLGLEQLLELRKTSATEGAEADEIALSAALIQRQAARLGRFVCGQCGFKARRHYWQCPGCSRWDTYSPRRTEELDPDATR